MIESAEGLQQLQEDFAQAGIATDSPGFYEDFQFIRRENKDPTYLDNYARFVQWQPYKSSYLEKAEEVIHIVVAEMQLALQFGATQAAYDETPLVISRILEREGIWNFVVHGAMSVVFPAGLGFEPYSFWEFDADTGSKKPTGYTWLYAPPFDMIDLSIQTQDFPHPVGHLLPRVVLEKDTEVTAGEPTELMSPAAIAETQKAGLSLEEGLDRFAPGFRDRFAPDFPAHAFRKIDTDTSFKFIPTRVITTEESLEQFKNFVSKGRKAMQVYEQEIRPRLKALKD
jgi:hypothetical protein